MKDHPEFSQALKETILTEWHTFVRSGFAQDKFSPGLHWFLTTHGAPTLFGQQIERTNFWQIYFNGQVGLLWAVIRQFCRRDVLGEGQDLDWWERYESPIFGDLLEAMVAGFEPLSRLFLDIIDDFETCCMQAEIDQKLAILDTEPPDLDPVALDRRRLAIYEHVQLQTTEGRYPVTPDLRRRLVEAAVGVTRSLDQPALFGMATKVLPTPPETTEAPVLGQMPRKTTAPPSSLPRRADQQGPSIQLKGDQSDAL